MCGACVDIECYGWLQDKAELRLIGKRMAIYCDKEEQHDRFPLRQQLIDWYVWRARPLFRWAPSVHVCLDVCGACVRYLEEYIIRERPNLADVSDRIREGGRRGSLCGYLSIHPSMCVCVCVCVCRMRTSCATNSAS